MGVCFNRLCNLRHFEKRVMCTTYKINMNSTHIMATAAYNIRLNELDGNSCVIVNGTWNIVHVILLNTFANLRGVHCSIKRLIA